MKLEFTLTDIDECTLRLHKCHENATCVNEIGTFRCDCAEPRTGDGTNVCKRTLLSKIHFKFLFC